MGHCRPAASQRSDGGSRLDRPLGQCHCRRPPDGLHVLAMVHSFFNWAQMSWWCTTVRTSTWAFAWASVVLLFGIVLLVGGVCLMSLRLLGLIMRDRPISRLARDLHGWM